jgi:hypothetical protein
MQSDGRALGGDILITLPALSHRQYDDPLPAFGTTVLTSGRTAITCDKPFFVYSATFRQGGAVVSFSGPSRALDSALTVAGADLAAAQVAAGQAAEAIENTTITRRIFTGKRQKLIDFRPPRRGREDLDHRLEAHRSRGRIFPVSPA